MASAGIFTSVAMDEFLLRIVSFSSGVSMKIAAVSMSNAGWPGAQCLMKKILTLTC
jgi:hypothetical protein